jgi:hypothetical protein
MKSLNNITVKLIPIWNGGVSMHDSDTGKIEIQIAVKNNSQHKIKIEKVYLRLKKKGIRFLFSENILIESGEKFIMPSETFVFEYDLKEFLRMYGEKRKFRFVLTGEGLEIKTSFITMSQYDSIIKALYDFHF